MFSKKKFVPYLSKDCQPIICENPLLDFIIISKLFYPESDNDNFKFKKNNKYKNLEKKKYLLMTVLKLVKNFNVDLIQY